MMSTRILMTRMSIPRCPKEDSREQVEGASCLPQEVLKTA